MTFREDKESVDTLRYYFELRRKLLETDRWLSLLNRSLLERRLKARQIKEQVSVKCSSLSSQRSTLSLSNYTNYKETYFRSRHAQQRPVHSRRTSTTIRTSYAQGRCPSQSISVASCFSAQQRTSLRTRGATISASNVEVGECSRTIIDDCPCRFARRLSRSRLLSRGFVSAAARGGSQVSFCVAVE